MQTSSTTKSRPPAKAAKSVKPGDVQGLGKDLGDRKVILQTNIFTKMYRASPLERINLIRQGVPAALVIQTGKEMGVPKEKVLSILHFPRATVNRRLKSNEALPTEYSERIIGLQKLIGQVETMVAESGDPTNFNAAHWVANWLEQPVAALNNAKPADYMDTIEGQELVSSLLAMMQSGAYA